MVNCLHKLTHLTIRKDTLSTLKLELPKKYLKRTKKILPPAVLERKSSRLWGEKGQHAWFYALTSIYIGSFCVTH